MAESTGESASAPSLPPLPEWLIPRPHLVSRLARGVLGPLTVVVGPPGAGKTALVTEWAHTSALPGPVVWVTCDGGKEVPGVFWPRVVAKLREVGVGPAYAGGAATAPPSGTTGAAGGRPWPARVAEGLARRTGPVVIVLDDFEPAPGSAAAEDVTLLLRHAFPMVRLIVVARRDPPLHLHRRRLAGELTELRTGDLAFTEKETVTLLAQHDVTLTGSAVRRLARRTEGWAAGLRLAAMSMAGHRDPAAFVRRFTGDEEAVVSYLAEEVLDVQAAPMRHLMLVTSILDRVNAELAAAVAGADADGRFAVLVRQNSFLHPLGEGWYRYHRMFRDVLLLRLRYEAPERVARLHRRAADWLGEHDLLPEALGHALAAGDPAYVAQVAVERLAVGRILGLTGETLSDDLIRRLSQSAATAMERVTATGRGTAAATDMDSARGCEVLLLAAAVTLAQRDVEGCYEALRKADAVIAGLPFGVRKAVPRTTRLTGCVIRMAVGAARAATAAMVAEGPTEPSWALAAAAEFDELCAGLPGETIEHRAELRAFTHFVRGSAELRCGRLKSAERSLLAALKAIGPHESSPLRRDCLIDLALLATVRGRTRTAAELAASAQRPEVRGWAPADRSRAALHVVRAWSHLARGEPAVARHELDRADAALCIPPYDPPVVALRRLAGETADMSEDGAPPTVEAVRDLCAAVPGPWPTEGLERTVRLACTAAHGLPRPAGTPCRAPVAVEPGRVPSESAGSRGAAKGQVLSGRERDVLEYLARTMTTEEIAAEMYLSVNTVKTHLKSVYRKLDVTRRSAAVRRAREWELL
ncbi:LuxR C-terminal-related transcriptional regulator [Streptomyces sp. NPDC053560]|uniref:LuxR C-terminal-related transcriptional regulator n=1 Tax=Streptomyces sp. NPDC053560 TaxID=3365711 RepID=UPI0037D27689